jgi:hypothetical protein
MAAGDAQRAWFPEMLDELKKYWSGEISWEETVIFSRHMTEERTKIRNARGIKPLQSQCPKCGGNMRVSPISVRSCLFALRKINVVNEEQFKRLEKEWNKYRRENGLDAYGNKT